MTSLPIKLDLPFKGNRDYLTGADLFNSLMGTELLCHSIAVRFHKLIHHPVRLEELEKPADKGSFSAVAYSPLRNPTVTIGVRELRGDTIRRRIEYPEGDVTQGANITDSQACLTGENAYSFIDRLVALNKRFLQHRHPQTSKWVFTGIDLDAPPPSGCTEILVRPAGSLGSKLVKSEIHVNGERLGMIYFSGQ